MNKLGVLLIRGSGDSGFKRQEKFIERLNKRLKKKHINPETILYAIVDWYAPLQEQQNKLMDRLFNAANIKVKSRLIRKLLLSNISDLITYGGKPERRGGEAYKETHKLVHKSIMELKNHLPVGAPMIILASSMGTEIINDYIHDRQKAEANDPFAGSPFERFETLVGLFTFGNNIPIFAASFDIDTLMPIQFPMPELADHLKSIAVWENYYDKNDPLGYPIKFINHLYENANVTDIQLGVGNPLSSWNILSHFGFWTSDKVEKRICSFISEVMQVLPQA
jgi:hypothetical protein